MRPAPVILIEMPKRVLESHVLEIMFDGWGLQECQSVACVCVNGKWI